MRSENRKKRGYESLEIWRLGMRLVRLIRYDHNTTIPQYHNTTGFTLIELLVAIALLSIVVAVGGEIFMSIIRSYNKANILNEVEQNGRYALSVMERKIRNSKRIPLWNPGPDGSITVEDILGRQAVFRRDEPSGTPCANKKVVMEEGLSPAADLTNTNPVSGVDVTALGFEVTEPVSAPPVVTITLTLAQGCAASARIDYQADITLTTTVSLRSY